jgi:hypothetical protein
MNSTNQIIQGEYYSVEFDSSSVTLTFKGELSLYGTNKYAPIATLLNDIADSAPATITIDLKELEFLNSSGISMLSKFALGLRKKKEIQLIVVGSKAVAWQEKSLTNLERLLPSLRLDVN